MSLTKYLALAVAAGLSLSPGLKSQAQVTVSVGVAPSCPYGYYESAPYNCAPAGYYGPEWFSGGVFVGAGPWFHGPSDFHGNVDNHYDPHHGYKGPMPAHGEKPQEHANHFQGNEVHDGHGHVSDYKDNKSDKH